MFIAVVEGLLPGPDFFNGTNFTYWDQIEQGVPNDGFHFGNRWLRMPLPPNATNNHLHVSTRWMTDQWALVLRVQWRKPGQVFNQWRQWWAQFPEGLAWHGGNLAMGSLDQHPLWDLGGDATQAVRRGEYDEIPANTCIREQEL